MQDLAWIGVTWDDVMRQSERRERYAEVFAVLERDGLVYPCFETEEELKAKQAFRIRRGQTGIYDRAMLRLTDKQRQDAEAGGKVPHWRFKLSGRVIDWRDMVQGHRDVALATISDPVLMQADGTPTALLASLIDDIDNETTHVIRGEDSLGNTAIQIELLEMLTGHGNGIRFAHLPTEAARTRSRSVDAPGRRGGPVSVRGLRQDGVEAAALAAALLGRTEPDVPAPDAFRLTDLKDAVFDMVRLLEVNRKALGGLPFDAVADRLPSGATEAFWLAVRGNLDLLREARGWWDVVAGTIVPPVVEGEETLLGEAVACLPPEPWDHEVWTQWTTALVQSSGRPQADIETPLRLALTGEENGPDLVDLLPLMGRARCVDRLKIAAA
jgi:glutamyl-tRNA synthetase